MCDVIPRDTSPFCGSGASRQKPVVIGAIHLSTRTRTRNSTSIRAELALQFTGKRQERNNKSKALAVGVSEKREPRVSFATVHWHLDLLFLVRVIEFEPPSSYLPKVGSSRGWPIAASCSVNLEIRYLPSAVQAVLWLACRQWSSVASSTVCAWQGGCV